MGIWEGDNMKTVKILSGLVVSYIGLGILWIGDTLSDLGDYILTKSTAYCNKLDSDRKGRVGKE